MRHPEAYCAFLSEFLARKVKLFGAVALSKALEIPGLHVSDDGRVTRIDGDAVAAVDAALQAYEKLSGQVSTINARGIVRQLGLRERYPELELPARLR